MSVDIWNLWSGAAGAVLVALFTVVYTEVREARGAVRELAGLARLLADEVERNEETVRISPPAAGDERSKELLTTLSTKPPVIDVWLETRVRLAQGLEREDFDSIADYYQTLQWLAMGLQILGPHAPMSARPISHKAASWQEQTADVKERLRRYASPGWRKEHLGF